MLSKGIKFVGKFLKQSSFNNSLQMKNFSLFNSRDHEKDRTKDPNAELIVNKGNDFRVSTNDYPLQFSKAPILDNFGELKHGEIPEPLKYIRPFEMTTLSNGIRVCTETWNSPVCAVGAFIDAGSRFETQETSGTAHFLEHLLFKGTKHRSKNHFNKEIEGSGSTLDAYTSREHTLFHMQCFKSEVGKCVEILGDMLQNPLFDEHSINEEKDTIKSELEHSNEDPQETIMEAVHFNSFRDHMIGQPILGDIDNIYSVTKDMIKEYHATHYVGNNLIIVGTGSVNHGEFVKMVEKQFGSMSQNAPPGLEKNNMQKPYYTPSCMFMRDDELYNTAVGVFFDAPSWNHEDYYAFMLLERIIGSYQLDKNGTAHLNNPNKQYSTLECNLGEVPDIQKAQAIYSPYRDCGLFGTYLYGNEVFTRQMTHVGISLPANYGQYVFNL